MASSPPTSTSPTTPTTPPRSSAPPPSSVVVDHHSTFLYKLLGVQNFATWSSGFQVYLTGRSHLHHVTSPPPLSSASNYASWLLSDQQVMLWIWNALAPSIAESCMLFTSAYDIWTHLRDTYGGPTGEMRLFDLQQRIYGFRQRNLTVVAYSVELQHMWSELDRLSPSSSTDPVAAKLDADRRDKERLFAFLAGLNSSYDALRCHILNSNPIPKLLEGIATIKREEQRRNLLPPADEPPSHPFDALKVTNKRPSSDSNSADANRRSRPRSNDLCTHCGRRGHLVATCWEIHGRPSKNRPPKPRVNSLTMGDASLTPDEVRTIRASSWCAPHSVSPPTYPWPSSSPTNAWPYPYAYGTHPLVMVIIRIRNLLMHPLRHRCRILTRVPVLLLRQPFPW